MAHASQGGHQWESQEAAVSSLVSVYSVCSNLCQMDVSVLVSVCSSKCSGLMYHDVIVE
jgi:hypothetical protein